MIRDVEMSKQMPGGGMLKVGRETGMGPGMGPGMGMGIGRQMTGGIPPWLIMLLQQL